jgi:hypothetical protein
MTDITLINRKIYDTSNIGAIICNTPKSLNSSYNDNGILVNNQCVLIQSPEELLNYFGDPYIEPQIYSELILVYDLVKRGIPVYVSSVYDMLDNDDGFDISYNGYTEFMFVDTVNGARYSTFGYKLKSDIKFCQPVISTSYNGTNELVISVHLYILDHLRNRDYLSTVKLDPDRFYRTLTLELPIEFDSKNNLTTTDQDLIDLLSDNGLELKVINGQQDSQVLIKKFLEHTNIEIFTDSYVSQWSPGTDNQDLENKYSSPKGDNPTGEKHYEFELNEGRVNQDFYWYNIHSEMYAYKIEEISDIVNAYKTAIDNLKEVYPQPHFICLNKILKSTTISDSYTYVDQLSNQDYSEDKKIKYFVKQSSLKDLSDLNEYIAVQNLLLSEYDSDSDTYLFINTPDRSYSFINGLLSDTDNQLLENYNCDLFYGVAFDNVHTALESGEYNKLSFPVSLLTMYTMLTTSNYHLSNPVTNINIANIRVKSIISESSARSLSNLRCNSIVIFDTGAPSIFGNRSLSLSPNLRYSHISRTFIRLRRLIREFLETQKFILNTIFNITSCINYIRSEILETFVADGILTNYTIEYTEGTNRSVYITIELTFTGFADSITLDFKI